ncbi:MAG: hypothetical protein OHK93_002196 [Ramalina farinacea]|uniref:Uncharacterized protein n=1 Tax=Ramalina farinacea TaxID=258253 RepID=A0AA43QTL8_9LECA|nr:hypothetical protein [Ramalina farinacea]
MSSCEREDKWLDESLYAIDTSMVPRGGGRRRKSMEPKALASLDGNLFPAENQTPAKAIMSPTKEFLTFNTPASRRDTFELNTQEVTPEQAEELSKSSPVGPSTPIVTPAEATFEGDMSGVSPTTPYYLSKGANLVQMTCPPKQKGERLFPVSGNVEDESDETVRQRLLAARRKSLQYISKTRSPLGRTVSYGKVEQ